MKEDTRLGLIQDSADNIIDSLKLQVDRLEGVVQHPIVNLAKAAILSAEAIKQTARALEEEEVCLDYYCKCCTKKIDLDDAHLHQGEYVGECCWDERLRTTE